MNNDFTHSSSATNLFSIADARSALRIIVVSSLCAFGTTGHGKNSQPSSEPAAASNPESDTTAVEDFEIIQLEEVVMSGQSAEGLLLETSTSVAMVTDFQIESLGLRDFRDSLRLLANVQAVSANNGNSGFTIRGINSEGFENPGANPRPLAALFIDGAPQSLEGIRRGMRSLWDVETVAVYRGPQTTLMGRSSLAGSILIDTKSPTAFWESALRGEVGQQDYKGAAFMVSGPLYSDEWMFRIAGETFERELGTDFSDPVGEEIDDDAHEMLRSKLLYVPRFIPNLEFEFIHNYAKDNPAVAAVNGDDPFSRKLETSDTRAEIRENAINSFITHVDYEISDEWSFKTIINFTFTDAQIYTTPSTYYRNESRDDSDFTNDIRVTYRPDGSDDFYAVFGSFYGSIENKVDSLIQQDISGFNYVVQDLTSTTVAEEFGVYAETKLPLGERLSLLVGARFSYDQYQTDRFIRRSFGATRNRQEAAEQDNDVFLPKGSLMYDFDADRSIAFTISQGYRPGFAESNVSQNPEIDNQPIEAEYLWNYEVSFRSTWLDGKLHINSDFFYYDWTDMQVARLNTATNRPRTENVGRAEGYGAELEVQYRITPDWTVGSSLGYNKTEFVDYKELSGNEFPLSPSWTGAVWSRLDFANYWFLSGDVAYIDEFYGYANVVNSELQEVPSYTLANLGLGYERTNWSLVLQVRNLLDKEYIVGRDQNGGTYVGDPFTATVRLTVRY